MTDFQRQTGFQKAFPPPGLLMVTKTRQIRERILASLSPRKLFLHQDTINDAAFGSTGPFLDPLLQRTIAAVNGRCNREADRMR